MQLFESARDYLAGYVLRQLALARRDPAAARAFAPTLTGKQDVDAIRQRAAALERLVSARQDARERAAHRSANHAVAEAIVVLVLLTLLTALLGGILGWLLIGRERARERSAFLAEASKQLDRAATVDQSLHTFGDLADGRLSQCCIAHALMSDAFETVTSTAQANCGDPALLALADAPPIVSAVSRVRAAAVAGAATASEALTLAHDGEPVRALVVAGMARGALVAETLLLRHGRPWSADQLREASELTSRLALAVHARGLQAETATQYERSERTALTLQESLLPAVLPPIPACELAVRFTPAGEGDLVGGDFYDVFAVGPDRWAIVVGDVCGKGAEAAAVTAMARWTLRSLSGNAVAPADALRFLNAAMLRDDFDERFITLAYLLVTVRAGQAHVTVACGGHPAPVLVPATGQATAIDARGDLVGIWPELRLQTADVRLDPGDSLVVYTDGVTDQGPQARRPPEAVLGGRADASAASLADSLQRHALPAGEEQRDDIAILALRFVGDRSTGDATSTPERSRAAAAAGPVAHPPRAHPRRRGEHQRDLQG